MASTKLILKMNKLNGSGEAPIYLRIIKNRKAQFVCMGVYIEPKFWDAKDKLVKKSHINYKRINAYLAQKMAESQDLILEMDSPNKLYSPKKVKRVLLGRSTDSFLKYADAYIDKLEQNSKMGTHDKANAVISKLRKYADGNDLTFDNIDVQFLKKYEDYLHFQLKNSVNTIHSNMKVIRRIINEAIKEDICSPERNPFLRYKLQWENVTKSFLTEEDLIKLENYSLIEGSKKFHHRNIYIFSCFSGGLRISDVLQLRWANFDGERILVKTQKTSSVISIKLPSKALDIINYYKKQDSKSSDFIFPFLKNDVDYSDAKVLFNAISSHTAYTNTDLKDISNDAEIYKPMNFHTSRHTWATRALKKGMRIEYVSKLMGHSSIKTTQVYTKIVNEDLDRAMDVFE
jgi:integrase